MRIICFGDSNTWGYDPRSYIGEQYPRNVRWQGRFAALPGLEPLESEENPNPLKTALTRAPFEADGHMNWLVPQGDGLGIELDPAALETFAV